MNIEEAVEEFSFFNEGDYITRKMSIAKDTILTAYEKEKEKNKTLKNLQNDTNRLYIEMIERKNYFERELQKLENKIKAKIEEIKKIFILKNI